ncbi:hypothetical protein BV898_15810 [Hypsibius exemplaris]|uniref:Uncharacterized protein n=1 Tax=Hypsibius exemplaris TaxID=2072580 RepID=A0A9X6NEN9_HYPEX|nr:hypothetical protein BV898_15810 [Hypsibius exemplaris]
MVHDHLPETDGAFALPPRLIRRKSWQSPLSQFLFLEQHISCGFRSANCSSNRCASHKSPGSTSLKSDWSCADGLSIPVGGGHQD